MNLLKSMVLRYWEQVRYVDWFNLLTGKKSSKQIYQLLLICNLVLVVWVIVYIFVSSINLFLHLPLLLVFVSAWAVMRLKNHLDEDVRK